MTGGQKKLREKTFKQRKMNYAEEIIDFLSQNGARNFAKIIYNVPLLFTSLKNPNLSMIFAPSDAALDKLIQATGKSLSQLQQDTYGVDIFANHLSTIPSSKKWPMFTAINNKPYGASEADIRATDIQTTTMIGKTVILVTNNLIVHARQVANASLKRDPGSLKILGQSDMLWILVLKGEIKGKDLISLCVSNPEVNKLCDSKLDFNQLLKRDYRATTPPNTRPRDYYVQLSMGYKLWTNVFSRNPAFRRSYARAGDAELSPMNEISRINTTVGYIQTASGNSFVAMLNAAGEVFIIGKLIVSENEVPPNTVIKLELPVPIVRIEAASTSLVMIDAAGHLYAYGTVSHLIKVRKYYNVADRLVDARCYGQVGDIGPALQSCDLLDQNYMTPTLIISDAPIIDVILNAIPGGAYFPHTTIASIIAVVDNLLEPNFDARNINNRTIQSVAGNPPKFIISSPSGVNQIEVFRYPFGRMYIAAKFDIVKVDGLTLLSDGTIWRDIEVDYYNYTAEELRTVEVRYQWAQVFYPAEKSLRFVDVAYDGYNLTWALSVDGRLFKINIANLGQGQGHRRSNLPNDSLTLHSNVSGVVSMKFETQSSKTVSLLIDQ